MPLTWTLKQWLETKRGLNFTTNRPLKYLKELQQIIKNRTGNKIALSTLHNLLEKQPKTLDCRILQIICDAFECQLKHFCAVKPSPRPPETRRDVKIPHRLRPCAIAANESLRSFTARVQLAAISQAVSMTDNFSQAARLLGCNRITLLSIRQRNKHTAKNKPPHRGEVIPLPTAIFIIRDNEEFDSFKRRIQLTAISETIKLEGNHTRAALRLGCDRTSIIRFVALSAQDKPQSH
jgi:DNA-binding protein Fis/DNA-binding Xre family transcriptional regulator